MKVSPVNSINSSKTKKQGMSSFLNASSFSKLLSDEVSSDVFLKTDEAIFTSEEEYPNEIQMHLKTQISQQEIAAERKQIENELESSKTQIEGIQKAFDILFKCLKIATRIISGDNVPAIDHQMLLENYPDIYSIAMSARQPKDNPKKHDSLIEDTDKKADALEKLNGEISKALQIITDSIKQNENS